MSDTGKVNIHGKEYLTVAYRVNQLRENHPDYRISTELISADNNIVVMKATIANADGFILATGHAEETRTASKINKTSAMENAETSAVGRALAFFGLAGSEIASADEVATAIQNQNNQNYSSPEPITPAQTKQLRAIADGMHESNPSGWQYIMDKIANGLTKQEAQNLINRGSKG